MNANCFSENETKRIFFEETVNKPVWNFENVWQRVGGEIKPLFFPVDFDGLSKDT